MIVLTFPGRLEVMALTFLCCSSESSMDAYTLSFSCPPHGCRIEGSKIVTYKKKRNMIYEKLKVD
jgi:hypothetical protein